MSARKILDLLRSRAQALRTDPQRNGPMLHLPAAGDLIVVGDLHNHRRNFERARAFADLKRHPERIVILQEIIHGGPLALGGQDTSFGLLVDALEWSAEFPGRVHFLLANHDLAQIQSIPIMKDGYDLTDRFNRYLKMQFGGHAEEIAAGFRDFVLSEALAAISVTGLFLSHSLPGPRDMVGFDPTVLRREVTEADLVRGGSAHKMIWGRHHTPELLQQLAKLWWADIFVCGHQPQDAGFEIVEPNMLIIDSCHNHGVLLRVDLGKPYTLPDLVRALIPLASLA